MVLQCRPLKRGGQFPKLEPFSGICSTFQAHLGGGRAKQGSLVGTHQLNSPAPLSRRQEYFPVA